MVSKELATSGRPVAVPQLGPEARLALDVALGVAGVAVGADRGGGAHRAPRDRAGDPAAVATAAARDALPPGDGLRGPGPHRWCRARGADAARSRSCSTAGFRSSSRWSCERLDLTRLVEENVDLDEIVATVDLDAAVARVDLDAAVRRVDLDAAVALVDIEAVIDRVDLDAVVATVDLDAAVARVDIAGIIDRVDLDAVVATVDLDAAVARVDLDAVIDRIDVIGIVEEVLDVIDLPAIIRDSTGSMASETVRGARMTSITADDAISKAVDRALFRRRAQAAHPQAPEVTP